MEETRYSAVDWAPAKQDPRDLCPRAAEIVDGKIGSSDSPAMASSSCNLAIQPGCYTEKHANTRRPLKKVVGQAFQIRCRKIQDSPQPFMISRRDAMVCLTSSLGSILYATSPAEAQPLNLDMGQIFKEKFNLLLEKAGLAKKAEPSSLTTEEKLPPGHQFMEQIEILKEKVGLSKESSPPPEENPSPPAEEGVASSEKEVSSSGSGKE